MWFALKKKNNKKQESPPAWTQEAYRPPRGHSNFLLFRGGGGGPSTKIFFFQSEHVSSQIWCQKFFPLLGGVPWQKIFFPIWTCIKPNLVSKNFPFTWWGGGRGGPSTKKIFFPVWTCIKPNLVSKNFPFTRGGPLTKNFFSNLNMYQAKSGVKKFSLYLVGGEGGSLNKKNLFSSLNMYQAKSGVNKFSLYWDLGPLLPPLQGWISLPENLRLGTPPFPPSKAWSAYPKIWDLGPPPKCGQTENIRKSSCMHARGILPAM